MKKKILAIIPARSGSKGISNKNLKKINNKSLIQIAVEKAIKSKLFDDVIISTDSMRYANHAKKYGANFYYLRPAKLSGPKTTLSLVVKDILTFFINKNIYYENVITIQPTSPFISASTLKKSIDIFFSKKGTGLAPISEIIDSHPLTAQVIDQNGNLKFLIKPKNFKILFPRQNRPITYKFSGGFYLRKSKNILNYKGDGWALGNKPLGIIINKKESFDINTKEDLKLAKILYEKK